MLIFNNNNNSIDYFFLKEIDFDYRIPEGEFELHKHLLLTFLIYR